VFDQDSLSKRLFRSIIRSFARGMTDAYGVSIVQNATTSLGDDALPVT